MTGSGRPPSADPQTYVPASLRERIEAAFDQAMRMHVRSPEAGADGMDAAIGSAVLYAREQVLAALPSADRETPEQAGGLPSWLTAERLAEAMRTSEAVPLGYGLPDTAHRILAALAALASPDTADPEAGAREQELREALAVAADIIDANIVEDTCRHGRYVFECDGEEDDGCTDRSRRELIHAVLRASEASRTPGDAR